MCTGHDTPQDRARARENGASGFVTKPVDDPALDSVLAQLQGACAGRDRPVAAPDCRRRDPVREPAEVVPPYGVPR